MTRILLVDDEVELLRSSRLTLLQHGLEGVEVEADGERALERVRREPWDVVVLDLNMPRVHGFDVLRALTEAQPEAECIVVTALNEASLAVEALRLGARDYVTKPLAAAELASAVSAALEASLRARATAHPDFAALQQPEAFADIVTISPGMAAVFRDVERIAPTDESVVITGASGTGKELIARALHRLSHRREAPFVGIDIAALPEGLFASQLFGHAAGAFSGANTAHQGYFSQAGVGTLFLDEIGELDLALQAQLLRALQEREFFAVGSTRLTPLQARVVVASNRDLRADTASGRFRTDLFYRLNATTVHVPRLADRPDDIPVLIEHFAREAAQSFDKLLRRVDPRTIDLLRRHPFPGNVRELRNVVRNAVLREDTAELRPASLPEPYRLRLRALPTGSARERMATLAELEQEHIVRVLDSTDGNVTQASEVLGISRSTLCRRLRRYNRGGS